MPMTMQMTMPMPTLMIRARWICALLTLCALWGLSVGCDHSEEAQRVSVPVKVSDAKLTAATTDLRYVVDLTECRVAIRDLEFTTAGETHSNEVSSLLRQLLLPTASAHAGHYAGGAVIGELNGRFIIDWRRRTPDPLGDATLLDGQTYTGLNLYFTTGQADDGLDAADPLLGHTAYFAGTATAANGQAVTFTAVIDQDSGRQLVGAPFDAQVSGGGKAAHLQLLLRDPISGKHLFDNIDFLALDLDADGQVTLEPDSESYNRLRRAMQSHDLYFVAYE